MEWISDIDSRNLLAIYDVMWDINEELNISPDQISIPLVPLRIKFPQLYGMDSPGARDDYYELRLKAVRFVKNKSVITDFELLEGDHRWKDRVLIKLQKDRFEEVFNQVRSEYKSRKEGKSVQGSSQFWDSLHPEIVKVSKSRFESKHFADAVEAALKKINNTVKELHKKRTGKELDGADLMFQALSPKDPTITLADLTTQTGRNIQEGCMYIFAGAMRAIRNETAHHNVDMRDDTAIHLLYLASLLMFKVDERI